MAQEVLIDKLVHGGQGIGTLPDGRKVFVWNALPDETVSIELKKSKKSHAEATAETIIVPSKERVKPRDEAFLSTSPWQIMDFETENKYKKEILIETFQREGVNFDGEVTFTHGNQEWHYRNKMEYSFWGDEDGLHLALFHRGSHGKRIVRGSSIAMPSIDASAEQIRMVLQKKGIRASRLKSVVVRSNQLGETVAALYVKDEKFPEINELSDIGCGLVVNYSNPKSPASVITRELYRYGDLELVDTVSGFDTRYDVNSFFQVNVPVFELALKVMKAQVAAAKPIIDMYSGVGTMVRPLQATALVEIDKRNVDMAKRNLQGESVEIIYASAENALEHIKPEGTLIVDPPRAGLHSRVVNTLIDAGPEMIVYLSCNPSTQARDLERLQETYEILSVEGFNFFPKTPHIESLACMRRKAKGIIK